MVCKDSNWACPTYANSCFGQLIMNGATYNIRDLCPRTCSVCAATPLTCQQAPNICENGATCTNINVAQTSEFGFKCLCPPGYSGDLCEIKNPNSCEVNPCRNGGTCQAFGSLGYICICPSACSGYNCSQCTNIPSTSPISSTIPSTKPASSTSSTRPTLDACSSSPCLNGATCQLTVTGYYCICTPECSGNTCNVCTPKDFDPVVCKALKDQGACSTNGYIGDKPIKEACALSCSGISTIQSTTQSTTRATPQITTVGSSNKDFDSATCQYYKSLGLCEKDASINNQPIKIACGASCNSGMTTIASNRVDLYPTACPFYKEKGLCELNAFIGPLPIKQACALSCNGNSISGTTSAPCFDQFPTECSLWKDYCYLLVDVVNHPCRKTCSRCV